MWIERLHCSTLHDLECVWAVWGEGWGVGVNKTWVEASVQFVCGFQCHQDLLFHTKYSQTTTPQGKC